MVLELLSSAKSWCFSFLVIDLNFLHMCFRSCALVDCIGSEASRTGTGAIACTIEVLCAFQCYSCPMFNLPHECSGPCTQSSPDSVLHKVVQQSNFLVPQSLCWARHCRNKIGLAHTRFLPTLRQQAILLAQPCAGRCIEGWQHLWLHSMYGPDWVVKIIHQDFHDDGEELEVFRGHQRCSKLKGVFVAQSPSEPDEAVDHTVRVVLLQEQQT